MEENPYKAPVETSETTQPAHSKRSGMVWIGLAGTGWVLYTLQIVGQPISWRMIGGWLFWATLTALLAFWVFRRA